VVVGSIASRPTWLVVWAGADHLGSNPTAINSGKIDR
jgi:hypothetical protein